MLSLKEPSIVLPTFSAAQVRLLVTWKPKGFYERRLHLLVLILLDTGCRIGECLTVHVKDVDFDNLLVTLTGKGDKQRVIPFSFELRRQVFRFVSEYHKKPDDFLLSSKFGTKVGRNRRSS